MFAVAGVFACGAKFAERKAGPLFAVCGACTTLLFMRCALNAVGVNWLPCAGVTPAPLNAPGRCVAAIGGSP